jgi:poly-gamma-glutamate synthase PgsB/CapB
MAVNPQYQWVSEHKMIQSTISVITNVRPDHLDEMGLTLQDNAMSLSNTIPYDGTMVTVEGDMNRDGKLDALDQQIGKVFMDVTKKRNTKLHHTSTENISSEYMGRFEHLEHIDNVALALEVCKLNGVDEKTALDGMIAAQPDPGATIIWELDFSGTHNYFVNLLAANDPSSTYNAYTQLQPRIGDSPVCIFLNTREDRRYRTNQLLNLVFTKIKPNMLIVRGEKLPSKFHDYKKETPKVKTHQLPNNVGAKELISEFSNLKNYYIVGIGNMVGWGEKFVQDLKEYRI